jgi:hypothetical protein
MAVTQISCNTSPNSLDITMNKILIALTLMGYISWFEKQKSIYTTEVMLMLITAYLAINGVELSFDCFYFNLPILLTCISSDNSYRLGNNRIEMYF